MKEKTIKIDREISNKSKPYLVAEIGLNHNNDLALTEKMITAAKESGADAVKFQTYITEDLIQKKSSAFNIFKDLELKKDDFKKIKAICKKTGITFFSSPFSLECIDWLEELNVPCYKIASSDINYNELLEKAAATGKPVILSTGMSDIKTIKQAVKVIEKRGNKKIIILHTISKYPPEAEDMDLGMITKLKNIFKYHVGFSDHSKGNTMSIIARTLGAVLFERHFTLDKNLKGPDHSISLTPPEFKDLREKLDMVDLSLSSPDIRSDIEIKKGARRGLYANCNIKEGTVLTEDMIKVVRPASSLSPEDKNLFIGKKIKKDINEDESFDLTCI